MSKLILIKKPGEELKQEKVPAIFNSGGWIKDLTFKIPPELVSKGIKIFMSDPTYPFNMYLFGESISGIIKIVAFGDNGFAVDLSEDQIKYWKNYFKSQTKKKLDEIISPSLN